MNNEKLTKIKERIEWLESVIWSINMIDHWTREDRDIYDEYSEELKQLKKLVVKEIVAQ